MLFKSVMCVVMTVFYLDLDSTSHVLKGQMIVTSSDLHIYLYVVIFMVSYSSTTHNI